MSKLNISIQCSICSEHLKFESGMQLCGFIIKELQFWEMHDKCEQVERMMIEKAQAQVKARLEEEAQLKEAQEKSLEHMKKADMETPAFEKVEEPVV